MDFFISHIDFFTYYTAGTAFFAFSLEPGGKNCYNKRTKRHDPF